jgi:hypothetical protein
LIVARLAAQAPLWPPGTRHGYHALTYGHLVGELVRRISGKSLGTMFRDEVAQPLGLDLWIGLPAEHEPRVSPTIPAPFPQPGAVIPTFYRAAMTDPTSVAARVLMNSGLALALGWIDSREAHAAELPAFGGIGNARALAGMYRVLAIGGTVDGVRLVDDAGLAAMGAVASASSVDATMLVPTRWSLGFAKSSDNSALAPGDQDGVVLSEDAFGHVGMGGSIGFAHEHEPCARPVAPHACARERGRRVARCPGACPPARARRRSASRERSRHASAQRLDYRPQQLGIEAAPHLDLGATDPHLDGRGHSISADELHEPWCSDRDRRR